MSVSASINRAVSNKTITISEGEHLLLFCNFANPLFILNTVGVFYLKNNILPIIILISHILSNVIIGIIFRKRNNPNSNYIISNNKSQSFSAVLSNSIFNSVNTLLSIAGTVTLFLILTTLITHIFKLNCILTLIVKSLLEMTMALSYLSSLSVGNTIKVVLSTMIISFSGLSIHLQIYSSLNSNISFKNYFKGRIYSLLLSSILSYMFINIIKLI